MQVEQHEVDSESNLAIASGHNMGSPVVANYSAKGSDDKIKLWINFPSERISFITCTIIIIVDTRIEVHY